MSLKDFKIVAKLGEGAYSIVYKVKRIEDNSEYALKKVTLSNLNEKEKQNALNEVRILASIRHPYIISYKEAFIDAQSNSLCMIMELADNGDLYQKIQKCIKTNTYVKETEILRMTYQMASALRALHELRILHRDLKSANVFLQANGDIKLGDMNVSKVAKQGLLYTQTGTPYYASPEVWKDQPYDCKSDIWSLGCVVYEMSALKPPFKAEDMEGLYKKVIRGLYPRIPNHYSQDLCNLIRMMLQVSTNLRPTAQGIMELPYFQKMKILCFESDEKSKLLNTITFPKNQFNLSSVLPKANYSPLKQRTEGQGSSDESQPRHRHVSTLGTSNQQSPIPTRVSQHGAPPELDSLLKQQHNISQAGRKLKRAQQSEHNMINRLLEEYQREISRLPIQIKSKRRRVSQEEVQGPTKRSQVAPLPVLDIVRNHRYVSVANGVLANC